MTQTSTTVPTVPAAGGTTGNIVVRRTIAATVDELFEAWLDPESLAQWMRPGAGANSTLEGDARGGGTFEVVMDHQSGPSRHYGEDPAHQRKKKAAFPGDFPATQHKETPGTVEFRAAR